MARSQVKVTKIKMNSSAVRDVLKSPEVLAELTAIAKRIEGAAGEGFEADNYVGRNRARATVRSTSWEGRVAEAKHRKLTRAIDAGRG